MASAASSSSYVWRALETEESLQPLIRYNTQSAILGDYLYLFLGNGNGRTSEVWRFNTQTHLWRPYACKGDMPPARDGHSITYIGNRTFLLFGGQGNPTDNDKSERTYDSLSIKTWHIRELYNSMYSLDVSGDVGVWKRFEEEGKVPFSRKCHVMTYLQQQVSVACATPIDAESTMSPGRRRKKEKKEVVDVSIPSNSLVLFGGAGMEPSKYTELLFDDLWSYQIGGSGIWTKYEPTGARPRPMHDHRAVLVENTMIVVGGITERVSYADLHQPERHQTDVLLLDTKNLVWSYLDLYDGRGRATTLGLYGFSICVEHKTPQDINHNFGGNSCISSNSNHNDDNASHNSHNSGQNNGGSYKSILIFGGREATNPRKAATEGPSGGGQNRQRKKRGAKHNYVLRLDINRGSLVPVKCKGVIPDSRYGHVAVSSTSVDALLGECSGVTQASGKSFNNNATDSLRKEGGLDSILGVSVDEPVMLIYGGSNVTTYGFCDPTIYRLVIAHKLANPRDPVTGKPYDDNASEMSVGSRGSKGSRASKSSKASRLSGGSSFHSLRDIDMMGDDDDDNLNSLSRMSIWEKMNESRVLSRAATASIAGSRIHESAVVPNPTNWTELKLALCYPLSEKSSMYSSAGAGRSTSSSSLRPSTSALGVPKNSGSVADSGNGHDVDDMDPATKQAYANLDTMPAHEKAAFLKKEKVRKIKKLSENIYDMSRGIAKNKANDIYLRNNPAPGISFNSMHPEKFFMSSTNSMSRKLTSSLDIHHHGSVPDAFDILHKVENNKKSKKA